MIRRKHTLRVLRISSLTRHDNFLYEDSGPLAAGPNAREKKLKNVDISGRRMTGKGD
jgi:hypothetical protein